MGMEAVFISSSGSKTEEWVHSKTAGAETTITNKHAVKNARTDMPSA
jgi:hypothetical protein